MSGEVVNIGFVVGNSEGFTARWNTERAELFGIRITDELSRWIDKNKPLTVEKLISLSEITHSGIVVTAPRVAGMYTLEENLDMIESKVLVNNTHYKAKW